MALTGELTKELVESLGRGRHGDGAGLRLVVESMTSAARRVQWWGGLLLLLDQICVLAQGANQRFVNDERSFWRHYHTQMGRELACGVIEFDDFRVGSSGAVKPLGRGTAVRQIRQPRFRGRRRERRTQPRLHQVNRASPLIGL